MAADSTDGSMIKVRRYTWLSVDIAFIWFGMGHCKKARGTAYLRGQSLCFSEHGRAPRWMSRMHWRYLRLELMSVSYGILRFFPFQSIEDLAGIASRSHHEIHHHPREALFMYVNCPDSKLYTWLVKITFLHIFCTSSCDSFSQKTMMDL